MKLPAKKSANEAILQAASVQMSYNESLGSRGAEEARNDHGEIFMGPFFSPPKYKR